MCCWSYPLETDLMRRMTWCDSDSAAALSQRLSAAERTALTLDTCGVPSPNGWRILGTYARSATLVCTGVEGWADVLLVVPVGDGFDETNDMVRLILNSFYPPGYPDLMLPTDDGWPADQTLEEISGLSASQTNLLAEMKSRFQRLPAS
eukprot:TRINITY_DN3317_c0_g2_i3.p2 TRINITY_DN3317_c0_g2~~TRINITY_DN3317_c0_g2_i3.p2  ORF type:complete len:149 (+),score=23.06 TRINITY_DN3317_c0_g2_i3:225-671(+)